MLSKDDLKLRGPRRQKDQKRHTPLPIFELEMTILLHRNKQSQLITKRKPVFIDISRWNFGVIYALRRAAKFGGQIWPTFSVISSKTSSQVRLVLGLMTTFGGSTIPIFSRSLKPTQPGHPSMGWCNEYRPPLGKKRRALHSSWPCFQDLWHTGISYAVA